MTTAQREKLIHSAFMFLAGLLAVGLSWLIGALTSHTVSLPLLLVPFTGLILAAAEYTYHELQPAPAPVSPPVVPPIAPPTPIVPPGAPPTLGV